MKLADIASRIDGAELGSADGGQLEIKRATADSRAVEPGDLFVAVRGLRADGHDYAGAAIDKGAAALVLERPIEIDTVPVIIVPNGAIALGIAAAALAGDPSQSMRMVGITGTNGKTTTSYLVEAMIGAAGREAGVIGTVGYRYGGVEIEAPYTTPTPNVLHATLGDMVAAKVSDSVLEVSSVALSMSRLAGLFFDVSAFTNLTRDHLDVHGTMDAYRDAKKLLFSRHLKQDGIAVINIDDDDGEAMIAAAGERASRILRVSTRVDVDPEAADVRVVRSSSEVGGIRATIATPRGEIDVETTALLGHFNVANVALAVAIGEALDLGHKAISDGIRALRGVPGRMERVANDHGLDILVDYAHTPDALANALDALRPLCERRLICVFGCGGDRDPSKRPLMGAAVAGRADLAIVTSDNPRSENPQAIIDMILPGLPDPFFVDVERAIAIKAAVLEATMGDVVLIAGKGHEDYQVLAETTVPFDDRLHASQAVAERAKWSLGEVAAATEGTVIGDHEAEIERVVIDGRAAAPRDLYVAIRGERVNGHDYIGQAAKSGASAFLVERGTVLSPEFLRVAVDDTRSALGALARFRRREWGRTVIGVTGSAGKTTTKGLIAAAARTLHPHASRGSLNNETGVPLSLLGLRHYHSVAVIEMGMRGLGQIDYLCGIAEPDVGVVVNAGVAHVGVVGSAADIVRGKAEVYARLPAGGTAIYPADDERLARFALAAPRRMSFGEDSAADVRLVDYATRGVDGSSLRIAYDGKEFDASIALYGRHNAINACCALAVAVTVGVSMEDAIAGLASARPSGMRGQRVEVAKRHLLVDCYNSNPNALEAALVSIAELAGATAGNAFAVIGDMLELGDNATEAHRESGRVAARLGIGVVSTGEFSRAVLEGARSEGDLHSTLSLTPQEAAEEVWKRTRPGDWILFKASRGAKLERAVEAVRELAEHSADG